MFCTENYSTISIYYQQNDKPTGINQRKTWKSSLATTAAMGEMCY